MVPRTLLLLTLCFPTLTIVGTLAGCGDSADGGGGAGFPETCATPAPFFPSETTRPTTGPGFIVFLKEDSTGRTGEARVSALEAKYGFEAANVYTSTAGFAASLQAAQLAGLRCDPEVKSVHENGTVGTND